jgi:hypothetical protein
MPSFALLQGFGINQVSWLQVGGGMAAGIFLMSVLAYVL